MPPIVAVAGAMSNLGVTKLIVLVGSGFAGSWLMTKNKLGEVFGDLSKVF